MLRSGGGGGGGGRGGEGEGGEGERGDGADVKSCLRHLYNIFFILVASPVCGSLQSTTHELLKKRVMKARPYVV